MTTFPVTNSTCDLADLAALWAGDGNFSHLTTPELAAGSSYTLDPSAVPSGLFAYYSCAATT